MQKCEVLRPQKVRITSVNYNIMSKALTTNNLKINDDDIWNVALDNYEDEGTMDNNH